LIKACERENVHCQSTALNNLQIQTRHTSPEVTPPAKKTKPDGSDAAANLDRVWPKPAGSLVQLLLLALYMSTSAENLSPDVDVSSKTMPLLTQASSQLNVAF
jgi:hypothetical protein